MAGVKISALPSIPSAQLSDVGPYVQSGVTYKTTLGQVVTLFNTNIQLASSSQVTGLPAALAGFLPISGGTMTGNLFLNTDPVTSLQAATKGYVDTVASGFTVILACLAATTGNLNATPAGAGVGATLTNAGAMAAFSVDGLSPAINSRILVKDQTLTQHNGIYTLTTVGSGAVNWVLTRATDYDQPTEITPGTLVAVNAGTVNANTSWLETATIVTVDTDPVLFSQFTFAPASFLKVALNLSDVANVATARTNLGLTAAATMTLPVSGANGGTGINNGAATITIGGSLTLLGAFTFTGTLTGNTAVTFPTSGTLLTNAQPTINQPNIVGVTNASSAAGGSVGEFISSVVLFTAPITIATSLVAQNLTSIVVTAGDWDVIGNVYFVNFGATITGFDCWCSLTSATLPDVALITGIFDSSGLGNFGVTTPLLRVNVNAPTTVYLTGFAQFSAGHPGMCGGIYARRVR